MNKKLKLTAVVSLVAIVALASGAFAFFSSTDEQTKDAIAGTVDMEVSDIVFDNAENINPGDNDPSLPEDPNRPEGTPHNISFSLENIGTKSIRTKHEITLTMEDETLDPSVFFILDINNEEVVKKYYLVNDEFLTQEQYNALVSEGEVFCSAVKYVIASDIFDGVGENSEKEDHSTIKEVDGKATNSYTYQLAMNQVATDKYQGKNVNINVSVFAIQYRNTDASGWYKISDTNLEGFTS